MEDVPVLKNGKPTGTFEKKPVIRQERRIEFRPKEGAERVPDGINTTAILAMAVAEIQSLRARVAELEARQ